jgi:hypothetical protein
MKLTSKHSLLLMSAFATQSGYVPVTKRRNKSGERPCLNCGELKKHNNSFCSVKCCKEYRGRMRNAR